MKVFLSYLRPERIVSSSVMPLGILYIASVLEQNNFEVRLFDSLFENLNDGIDSARSFAPDVIGVSFISSEYKVAKEWIRLLRQACPRSLIVAGGPHVGAHGETSLKALGLDFAIYGEGELAMLELCQRIRQGRKTDNVPGLIYSDSQGKAVRTAPMPLIQNLDTLPFPARHLLDVRKYLLPPGWIRSYFCDGTLTFYASRGCPAHCTFCDSYVTFGRNERRHSVGYILREIESVRARYNFSSIYFMDDTFTLDQKWVLEFCQAVKSMKLEWGCQTRVTSVNRELLQAMKDSGCIQVDYGVESGSDKILNVMKKGVTSSQIKQAFEWTHEIGLRASATMIVGFPEESVEDIEQSIQLAKKIRPTYLEAIILVPYPGTGIYEQAKRNHWINIEELEDKNWDMTHTSDPILKVNFSGQELLSFRSQLQNANFYRNYIGILTLHNLPYILQSLWIVVQHPIQTILAIRETYITKNMDVLVRYVYGIYQKYTYQKFVNLQRHDAQMSLRGVERARVNNESDLEYS